MFNRIVPSPTPIYCYRGGDRHISDEIGCAGRGRHRYLPCAIVDKTDTYKNWRILNGKMYRRDVSNDECVQCCITHTIRRRKLITIRTDVYYTFDSTHTAFKRFLL